MIMQNFLHTIKQNKYEKKLARKKRTYFKNKGRLNSLTV